MNRYFFIYARTHAHIHMHLNYLDIEKKNKVKNANINKAFTTMQTHFWKIKHIENNHTRIVLASSFIH